MKQYSKTIPTSFDFLDNFRLAKTDNERYNLLLEEIDDTDVDDYYGNIEQLLFNYDYGHGTIQNVEITDGEVSKDGKGVLNVEFEVDYYFGCDDYNRTDEDNMQIGVSINFKNGEITIIGEEEQERLPDEY
jgi:hypothetical protein